MVNENGCGKITKIIDIRYFPFVYFPKKLCISAECVIFAAIFIVESSVIDKNQ